MAVGRDGHKWFITAGGVSELDNQGTRRKDDDTWTPHDLNGYDIAADSEGKVWVTTRLEGGLVGTGVAVWNGERWQHYSTVNSGLPHDFVNDIAVDAHDVKWFATSGGVARFEEHKASAEIPEPGTLLLVGLGLGSLGVYLARRRVVTTPGEPGGPGPRPGAAPGPGTPCS